MRKPGFAIVGTGRVACALARRLVDAERDFIGVVGRTPHAVGDCLEFAGGDGRALEFGDLTAADIVILAVDDAAIADVQIAADAAGGVRPGAIWMHTSGRHDLDVLGAVGGRGARVGSLHPACPIPDRDEGVRLMAGAHGVLQGDAEARGALEELARDAGMQPVWVEHGDRVLYHAACALAANGLTALHDQITAIMTTAGVPAEAAAELPLALMAAALDAIEHSGSLGALSGPAVRGDAGTIADHLAALTRRRPEAVPMYRELLGRAAQMAMRRGDLDAHQYSTLAAELQFGSAQRRRDG